MGRSKPPRSGTEGAARPARTRRPRPDLAAAVQATAPPRAELLPDSVSAAALLAAVEVPPEAGPAPRAVPPAADADPRPPAPDDLATLSLSVLDFYRKAAEAQFTFWSALMETAVPRRDDEAA